MAFALSLNTAATLWCSSGASSSSSSSSYSVERFLNPRPPGLTLPCHLLSRACLAFARRRNQKAAVNASSSSKRKKKKSSVSDNRGKSDEDLEDDPFEALFSMLEEDLKSDKASTEDDDNDDDDDDDDGINEEDIDALARELEEVLRGDGDIELRNLNGENDNDEARDGGGNYEDDYDSHDDDDKPLNLRNWQLRRLAYALKVGRRKTSIKNLSAELCLDRAIVLELLRDPPPNLLMLSATLPDEPSPAMVAPENKPPESDPTELALDSVETTETHVKEPVHVMQHRWSAQKRLKKVHVETLQKVYKRSKRPTNAMISSIVQVTNLPRKRIVKWFEDKRTEDGIPHQHTPYQRTG